MSLELVEKRCPTCGEVKPASGFHRNRANKDGLNVYCKPCWQARTAEAQAKKRAEMGDEAWLAANADAVRASRARRNGARERLYAKAQTVAARGLREAHRAEYDARLRLALDELEREAKV